MREINKVAVLGAGVMGSTIAAHLANAGIEVLLLDLPSDDDPNKIAKAGLDAALKAKPAAFYLPDYSSFIKVGNFRDDIPKVKDYDWVIEVVVERMDIKKSLLNQLAPHLNPNNVFSSNTSGLSINEMAETLPENLRKNFLITHFFNPPRYMRLLEIVPSKYTDPKIVKDMAEFISHRLGKGIVYAKDTPNFVANRIGVYSIFNGIKHMLDMGLTVEEVDAIAGPATARAKSAAFRTSDLVGTDTMVHVANNTYELLKDDDEREIFRVPEFLNYMVEKKLLGNKTKQGFYKKEKVDGKNVTYYFDYNKKEYVLSQKPKFASIEMTKQIDDKAQALKTLISSNDKAAQYAWKNIRDTIIYAAKRIPEIADDVVNIDNAMKWGFNWELGPFEMLDAIGIKYFVDRCEKESIKFPEWLKDIDRIYKIENGKKYYYDCIGKTYKELELPKTQINLELLKSANKVVEKNSGASLIDLGDGVFCLEFHTKMNAIGAEIITMINKSLARAQSDGIGLVIANQGKLFSAGANLMLIASLIAEGDFAQISQAVKTFQKASMSIKYAKVPVVAAPFNLTLGGGCEISLHSDAIVAHAETYMGLVEVGVGLIPGGGGTKEMTLRSIEEANLYNADVSAFVFKAFQNIAMAKVSMSADELFQLGYLRRGDSITMNIDNLIFDAKQKVIALSTNYRPQKPKENLSAPGRSVAASIKAQLWNMKMGGYITEYEEYLGGLIANVMTGGDVPAGTLITEEYLLDLEREAFLKACGNKKTLERIQHMLKTGKPLRN
ncbi:3-hydroxyacyl-CoA dehydrogenase [Desulfurella multipotens]|uniref:3-hydroxyacyl-CoA dehydrogenase n=1 Tax=Desulfurella multipotens TaxID=79269 RepID=A0A1G6LJC1_9BACT|nr:3-hydroxyacyl-CoA dehydrogenase/enoyl-CoA hydratase family protein [Desulfurella multipotens]SDC43482.1 3-hydroxyacyl-CoA dehydrogenase [Desulfurella multipotens]